MQPHRRPTTAALGLALALACLPAPAQHPVTLTLNPVRRSASDLEITGLVAGAPGFLTLAQLATLPQVAATVTGDPDLSTDPHRPLHLRGVPLQALAAALHPAPQADLLDALCADRYRAHYPAASLAAHHPILALTVDGLAPAVWAARYRQDDPGPLFIAYPGFTPAFHILAHQDQPQKPLNIVRLNFSRAADTFGPIAPPAGASEQVQQGFRIARQNCIRCHSLGATGGSKSGRGFAALGARARDQPRLFAAYAANPRAIDAHALMPPNPTYDAATLAALTAYFRTFAPLPSNRGGKP